MKFLSTLCFRQGERIRRPRGGGGGGRGGAGGVAPRGERDHRLLLGREADRAGVLRQGVPGHDAERPARRREAAREAVQARVQRGLPQAAVGGVQAQARQLRPPARVHHQRRPPAARLRVRHHGHPLRRPARRPGGGESPAGAQLDAPGAHRAGRGAGAGVPARDHGDAQGPALHQRAALRGLPRQDRRLQHVQPGRGHGEAQPVHAHARLIRLPGAGVRDHAHCSALSLSDRPFELLLSTDVFSVFRGGLCSGTP
jgi:hypothetical protein